MTVVVAFLVTLTVSLLVFSVGAMLAGGGSAAIRGRLVDSRLSGKEESAGGGMSRDRIEEVLERVGRRVVRDDGEEQDGARTTLLRAGYRGREALAVYYGARIAAFFAFGVVVGGLASVLGWDTGTIVLASGAAALVGWYTPTYVLRWKAKERKKEIQKALADALDLLVVCVEAGLGLNQALQRVSREIHEVSEALAEELAQVNLEIRAGAPRAEALRNLGVRTDLADLRSLTAMLIQTDRFGTSIAKALRVHADTLRTKRRQRAEEQAAKTTIKLVFPLVLFIFPAMFVVILAPAIIHIMDILQGL